MIRDCPHYPTSWLTMSPSYLLLPRRAVGGCPGRTAGGDAIDFQGGTWPVGGSCGALAWRPSEVSAAGLCSWDERGGDSAVANRVRGTASAMHGLERQHGSACGPLRDPLKASDAMHFYRKPVSHNNVRQRRDGMSERTARGTVNGLTLLR